MDRKKSNEFIPVLATNNVAAYAKNVVQVKDLTLDQERELFKKYREENDLAAAQKIIMANLKLVIHLSYKFRHFRDVADLIQEGNIGLMIAFSKFDLSRDVKFATYASWWIKAKLQEFIISQMSIVRFGKTRDERKLFFNMISTIKDIESYDKGRDLTKEELIQKVADRLELSVEKIRASMKTLSNMSDMSIDTSFTKNDSDMTPVSYQLEDMSTNVAEEFIDKDYEEKKKDIFGEAFAKLSEREKDIINRRYITSPPETLESIGNEYGVTKERIRQIEANAILKMKKMAGSFFEPEK